MKASTIRKSVNPVEKIKVMFTGDRNWFRVNTKVKDTVHPVSSHSPRATGHSDCSQYTDEEAGSLASKQLSVASPGYPNPAQQKAGKTMENDQ